METEKPELNEDSLENKESQAPSEGQESISGEEISNSSVETQNVEEHDVVKSEEQNIPQSQQEEFTEETIQTEPEQKSSNLQETENQDNATEKVSSEPAADEHKNVHSKLKIDDQILMRDIDRWCVIDDDGNVRQRDGEFYKGKVIGKIYNKANKSSLLKNVHRFRSIADKVNAFIKEFERSNSKASLRGKLLSITDMIMFSDGIGDFDSLLSKLKDIEDKISSAMEENLKKKEKLLEEAESLKDSKDWKKTADRLKALQEEWKKIGPVTPEKSDEIWNNFRKAIDVFFNNRQAFFNERREEENNNLLAKQKLCEEVENLLENNDLNYAVKRVKEIQAEWSKIGFVPRQYTDLIWQRFREACDKIFNDSRHERNKRKEEFKLRKEERGKRLSEVLKRYQEKEKNLISSIERDEENIQRWEDMRSRVKVTDSAQDFLKNLETKINDVKEKMEQKKTRLVEIQKEIKDLSNKVSN